METKDLLQTMDADKWAKEFIKLNPDATDLDMMRAWFANAIMTGWDHAHWKLNKKYETLLYYCSGVISTIPEFSDKPPMDVKDWIVKNIEEMGEE